MQQIKYKEDRTLKMGHTIVVDEKYSVEITKLEATWSLTSTYEVDVDYTIELKITNEHGETLCLHKDYYIENLAEHPNLLLEFEDLDEIKKETFSAKDMGYASIDLFFS